MVSCILTVFRNDQTVEEIVTRVTIFLLSDFSIGEAQRRGGKSVQEVPVTSAHNEYL